MVGCNGVSPGVVVGDVIELNIVAATRALLESAGGAENVLAVAGEA